MTLTVGSITISSLLESARVCSNQLESARIRSICLESLRDLSEPQQDNPKGLRTSSQVDPFRLDLDPSTWILQ